LEGTSLSDREMEILRLVATGATNQQIARGLVISANTVKVHLRNIYAKLGVQSRTEATMVAVRQGWVTVPRAVGAILEPEVLEATTEPAPTVLDLATPSPAPTWSRVSPVKRLGLLAALLVALLLAVLPEVLEGQGNNGVPNPIQGVFPTATAPTGAPAARWRTRAQMPTPRDGLAVVEFRGLIYAIGGVDNDGVTGKVEVYDPQTDSWTVRRAKPVPVAFAQAVAVGDKIYVPGGIGSDQQAQDVLEIYDPAQDRWETGETLPRALGAYAAAAQGENLFLFGGFDGQAYLNSVYHYDVQSGRWEERKPMTQARGFLGAAAMGDLIYVVGGLDGDSESRRCDIYDPASDTWTPRAWMHAGRGGLALVAVREHLYAVGGGMEGYLASGERYDRRLDEWTRIETPVTAEWWGLGAAYVKPNIYAIGGWSGGNLSTNESYQALFQQVIGSP